MEAAFYVIVSQHYMQELLAYCTASMTSEITPEETTATLYSE